jgi:pteridine reductase
VGDLRDKRALVTGAGRRLGSAISRALGAEGMRLVLHFRESRVGAEETAARVVELGGKAELVGGDLADRREARRVVDESLGRLRGLDLLVLSAARFERVDWSDVDDAAWDRTLALNLTAPWVMVQRAAPALAESRGSVVFLTCTSATTPFNHHLPYVVSKGALRHLMRTLALELAPRVRVNAVAPGTVLPPEGTSEEELERLVTRIPLGHQGDPEDVARAVVFLAKSDFVTGHEIVVDGGRTVARLW